MPHTSVDMTLQIESTSSDNTEALAASIGGRLKGGEVLGLSSDLGGGKTTFVRGLAQGMGSADRVASPTFTISKVYVGPKLAVYHFDFYRLHDPGVVAHELHDVIGDPDIVVAIEWGDTVQDVLPDEHMGITLVRSGDTTRTLRIEYPTSYAYLVEGL